MDFSSLVHCIGQSWSPKIGDPNITGWLTVVAYMVCATLSLWVAFGRGNRAGRAFWLVLGIVMMCLAVNKQLDLQSALTAAGRCLARAQGWYDDRRGVQVTVIASIGVLGVLFLVVQGALLWGRLKKNLLAFFGLVFVLAYVGMRAVGFHHMDILLRVPAGGGLTFNYLFENFGLLLIAVNALWHLRQTDDAPVSQRHDLFED